MAGQGAGSHARGTGPGTAFLWRWQGQEPHAQRAPQGPPVPRLGDPEEGKQRVRATPKFLGTPQPTQGFSGTQLPWGRGTGTQGGTAVPHLWGL